jgi:hypothetical protein
MFIRLFQRPSLSDERAGPEVWLGDDEEHKLNETLQRLRQARKQLEDVRVLRRQQGTKVAGGPT